MSRTALGALLAGLLAAGCSGPADTPGPPPDILVVVADDLGWPELESAATPELDRLAREGVTLTSFFGMPNCSPARHALLHGRWPRRSGVGSGVNSYAPPSAANPTPPAELLSLPKVLRSRGYRTALVGKWHLGQASAAPGDDPVLAAPLAHGFDDWLAGTPANIGARESRGYDEWVRVDNGVRTIEKEHATRAQRDAALRWWRDTPSPKFLLVSLSAIHTPLLEPPQDLLPPGTRVGPHRSSVLAAMVASVDTVVGNLRSAIDPERTLFLLLSDNGSAPFVTDAVDGVKGTTFDGGVRVPFLAAGPGLARGGSSAALASIVDVMATLAEAAGIELAPGPRGGGEDSVSFLGALREPATWRAPRPWVLVELYDEDDDDLALREAGWKLRQLGGVEQLFDLTSDPREERPLDPARALEGPAADALRRLRALRDRELPQRASSLAR